MLGLERSVAGEERAALAMATQDAVQMPGGHTKDLGRFTLRNGFGSLFGGLPGQHGRTTNAQTHIVKGVCAFTVRFSDKIQSLMRKRRLTQLELGKDLGISHTSVGRWLSGSVPHKRTVAQLATYFGVSMDDLLDDARDLPLAIPETSLLSEESPEYLIMASPLKTAAALAQRERGESPAAGQAAFEKHLANLRSMRTEAERLHPGNPTAAFRHMDTLLASYITAHLK
jgi:transcriptional regulator with XRE-family HTH domain